MQIKWRRFWLFHAAALALMLIFAVYGHIVTTLFPKQDFYHCFVHDVLRLYCPFCGFTRASQALLRLDIVTALRLNPAVVSALAAYAAVDVRAFVLLCRGDEGNVIPRALLPASLLWFGLYTVLLNGLLLFGIDPIGDQLAFWQDLRLPRAVGGTLLLAMTVGLFLYLLWRLYHRRRRHLASLVVLIFLAAALLLAVLWIGR